MLVEVGTEGSVTERVISIVGPVWDTAGATYDGQWIDIQR